MATEDTKGQREVVYVAGRCGTLDLNLSKMFQLNFKAVLRPRAGRKVYPGGTDKKVSCPLGRFPACCGQGHHHKWHGT
jgi:hypothetical protein